MGVGGQRHASAALSSGKTRYSLYRRLGGPQGRCGRLWKILPQPGFDPRTVQPVASRYTDWAIPVHLYMLFLRKLSKQNEHTCYLFLEEKLCFCHPLGATFRFAVLFTGFELVAGWTSWYSGAEGRVERTQWCYVIMRKTTLIVS